MKRFLRYFEVLDFSFSPRFVWIYILWDTCVLPGIPDKMKEVTACF